MQVMPYYLAGMDAIHAISPATLFMVEGCGQTAYPRVNWGDGFVADPGLIDQYKLSDPKPFFNALTTKPYNDRVYVHSPCHAVLLSHKRQ